MREAADESVLVVAADADLDVEIPAPLVLGADRAEALFGDATLGVASDGTVLVSADGPSFAVWRLPGVNPPAWPAAS